MLKDHNKYWTEGTHIIFRNIGKVGKKITDTYQVVAKAGSIPLGSISWFGRWRKYCFDPLANTIYEETCLREIAEFIERETRAYKKRGK